MAAPVQRGLAGDDGDVDRGDGGGMGRAAVVTVAVPGGSASDLSGAEPVTAGGSSVASTARPIAPGRSAWPIAPGTSAGPSGQIPAAAASWSRAASIAVVKLARAGSVPLLTGYLQACGRNGGAAPAEAGLDPFLPWTPKDAGRRRMARGRRGSLTLRRRALTSPPPCRFIPALSQDHEIPRRATCRQATVFQSASFAQRTPCGHENRAGNRGWRWLSVVPWFVC